MEEFKGEQVRVLKSGRPTSVVSKLLHGRFSDAYKQVCRNIMKPINWLKARKFKPKACIKRIDRAWAKFPRASESSKRDLFFTIARLAGNMDEVVAKTRGSKQKRLLCIGEHAERRLRDIVGHFPNEISAYMPDLMEMLGNPATSSSAQQTLAVIADDPRYVFDNVQTVNKLFELRASTDPIISSNAWQLTKKLAPHRLGGDCLNQAMTILNGNTKSHENLHVWETLDVLMKQNPKRLQKFAPDLMRIAKSPDRHDNERATALRMVEPSIKTYDKDSVSNIQHIEIEAIAGKDILYKLREAATTILNNLGLQSSYVEPPQTTTPPPNGNGQNNGHNNGAISPITQLPEGPVIYAVGPNRGPVTFDPRNTKGAIIILQPV